ncbi:unnamed protein product [Blepharisma stoltei]|uniref:DUF4201 domain-containing protein n=1 Tax=Blepharisma stoltei TaxID=1481888 RepID=A0AAU9IV53_9CILI|nr:unnamed protein product [Blepharisma stoltei]
MEDPQEVQEEQFSGEEEGEYYEGEEGDYAEEGEYGEEGEYAEEEGDYMEQEGQQREYSGEYGEEEEGSPYQYAEEGGEERNEEEENEFDDDDINFDEIPAYKNLPPLDPLRKVRRELLRAINNTRQEDGVGLEEITLDLLTTESLQEYTKYVLEEEEDSDVLEKIISEGKGVGKFSSCTAITFLEEETTDTKHLIEPFVDAHGLLVELKRSLILDPGVNHVGIGVAAKDLRLVLVYAFSHKGVQITEINKKDSGIYVRGLMKRANIGVYALRVVDAQNLKEKAIVSPSQIEFDVSNQEFTISFNFPEGIQYDAEGKGLNYVEIYVRGNPNTIPYGVESNEKVKVDHLELVQRMRLEIFPDPRHLYEEAKSGERKAMLQQRQKEYEEEKRKVENVEANQRYITREQQRKELQELEKLRIAQENEPPQSATSSVARGSQQKLSGSQVLTPEAKGSVVSSKEKNEADENESQLSLKSEKEDEPEESQELVKEELMNSIIDLMEGQRGLRNENADLEKRVIGIRQKMGGLQEKTTEDSMTLHKYLNTLANVHQVDFKMQELQDTYNNWAQVYEENIIEKQERCKEIQNYFRDFKREVAKGAEFSRTGKPITKRTIDEWENAESERDKTLQEVRIQNITLKNRLMKLEEQSKDKEKLAEGLHLIDYEQLKIENQTLNEKIEERNEELHKLRKKIETTVQILTHTKEKLKFILAEKLALQGQRDDLAKSLDAQRKELHKQKLEQEEVRSGFMKHKQETGIVNSTQLNTDLEVRKKRVEELKHDLQALEKDFQHMQSIIAKAAS